MDNCIFCKIVAGEIPSAKVYEDDKMLVFKDIEPKAKVHLLCVPKEHFAFLSEADEKRAALIGSMLQTVGAHYKEWGLQEGYRVVINQGENAGQTVMHLHMHLLHKLRNTLSRCGNPQSLTRRSKADFAGVRLTANAAPITPAPPLPTKLLLRKIFAGFL